MAIFSRVILRVRLALLRVILSDQVRPFVWLYYSPLWAWGCYGTFLGAPVSYVRPIMGQIVYDGWIWLHLIGTSVVMLGLHFETMINQGHRAYTTTLRDKLGYMGLPLQLGGHACMFFILLAYVLSGIQAVSWGEPATYSIVVVSPYVFGCLLLSVQTGAKIIATEAIKRRLLDTDCESP